MENILEYRRTRCSDVGTFNDIQDGYIYKYFSLKQKLGSLNQFSVVLNFDGVKVFKDKDCKVQAWPVFVVINELPPKIRFKYIYIVALYVDEGNPVDLSFLLEPVCKDLAECYSGAAFVSYYS